MSVDKQRVIRVVTKLLAAPVIVFGLLVLAFAVDVLIWDVGNRRSAWPSFLLAVVAVVPSLALLGIWRKTDRRVLAVLVGYIFSILLLMAAIVLLAMVAGSSGA